MYVGFDIYTTPRAGGGSGAHTAPAPPPALRARQTRFMLGTAGSPANDSLELTSGQRSYAIPVLPWPLAAQFKR